MVTGKRKGKWERGSEAGKGVENCKGDRKGDEEQEMNMKQERGSETGKATEKKKGNRKEDWKWEI